MRHDMIDVVGQPAAASAAEWLRSPDLIAKDLPSLRGVKVMACRPAVLSAPSAGSQVGALAAFHRDAAHLETWHAQLPQTMIGSHTRLSNA
jgi:hypothetical protein